MSASNRMDHSSSSGSKVSPPPLISANNSPVDIGSAPGFDPKPSRPNSIMTTSEFDSEGLRSLLDAVDDRDANSLITMANKLSEGRTTRRQLKSEFQNSDGKSDHEGICKSY
jgi:hypothetical protein